MEQKAKADCASEKFGKIGGHGGDLADYPHDNDKPAWKMQTTYFGKIQSGDKPELGR